MNMAIKFVWICIFIGLLSHIIFDRCPHSSAMETHASYERDVAGKPDFINSENCRKWLRKRNCFSYLLHLTCTRNTTVCLYYSLPIIPARYILMGYSKKDETPLLTHRSYICLALTNQYIINGTRAIVYCQVLKVQSLIFPLGRIYKDIQQWAVTWV